MFPSLALLAKQRRELDAAEAAWLSEVATFDRSGDWQVDGFRSSASAIGHACRIDVGIARRYVDLARKLERLPVVAEAFAAGDISERHAQVVASAYTPDRADQISYCEPELIEQARAHAPKVFGAIMRYVTDAIDGDRGAGTDAAEFERRTCYTASTLHGRYDLQLSGDRLSGEVLETAIRGEMTRDHQPSDPRTTPQRRFDAVVNICRAHLERGEVGETHGIRPHVNIVIDINELPRGSTIKVPTQAPRHRLSAAMVEMVLCDCDVTRVVMAGPAEVLDVGRANRNPTAAQWKALVARDRHCQAPDCTRPPSDCHTHHKLHWTRGGSTDLANLELQCWFHHRQTHQHDAQPRAA